MNSLACKLLLIISLIFSFSISQIAFADFIPPQPPTKSPIFPITPIFPPDDSYDDDYYDDYVDDYYDDSYEEEDRCEEVRSELEGCTMVSHITGEDCAKCAQICLVAEDIDGCYLNNDIRLCYEDVRYYCYGPDDIV